MAASRVNLLLDPVIVIDHFNGIDAATRFPRSHYDDCAISAITRAEVMAGFDTLDDASTAAGLLDRFSTLGIDKTIADLAAALRREHRWKLPDAFQAAIAHHHALKLVTRNTKDFPPRDLAFVAVPYTL